MVIKTNDLLSTPTCGWSPNNWTLLAAANIFQINLNLWLWHKFDTSGAKDSMRICINWQSGHFVQSSQAAWGVGVALGKKG